MFIYFLEVILIKLAFMSKQLEVKIQEDYLQKQTKTNPINAIAELIWNSLDADATSIKVNFEQDEIRIDKIIVIDNGHGLSLKDAEDYFQKIGGSYKRTRLKTATNRLYHGKEGKGRYRAFSLGNHVEFVSYYKELEKILNFEIDIDISNLKHPTISDASVSERRSTGFTVIISDVNQTNGAKIAKPVAISELEEKFAIYYQNYRNFQIIVNNYNLDFSNAIKNQDQISVEKEIKGKIYEFDFKCIEWNSSTSNKKIHFGNLGGIVLHTSELNFKSSSNVSLYILSEYIQELHDEGSLDVSEFDSYLIKIIDEAKEFLKSFVRKIKIDHSKDFIAKLKQDNIYPFNNDVTPGDNVENTKRQVFDLVAIQIKDNLKLEDQTQKTLKFTLSLVKEALENSPTALNKVLKEVLSLPKEKINELNELLTDSSLIDIIDTMKEIQNRINFINDLETIIFNKQIRKNFLERRQFQKILEGELWIFGDEFTFGVFDQSLKNVLKQYLNELGREEFIDSLDGESELEIIPDICLFKQYPGGKPGYYRNLVIEIKRPSKKLTSKETLQIKKYSRTVNDEKRFPKDKTEWIFYLIGYDWDADVEFDITQNDRPKGVLVEQGNVKVFVKNWSEIISECKGRLQYLRDKLNYNITQEEGDLKYLNQKYSEYLPEDVKEKIIN